MVKPKLIAIGGILTGLAVIFQITPVIFSEIVVFLTVLSALPVYVMTRVGSRAGAIVLAAVFILTMLFSVHEALFFICTNGPVGFGIGICHGRNLTAPLTALLTGLLLTLALSFMNYIIGIPVFGTDLPGQTIIQILIIFSFSVVYSFFYSYIASLTFRFINRFSSIKQ